jgi:hypothetical protein
MPHRSDSARCRLVCRGRRAAVGRRDALRAAATLPAAIPCGAMRHARELKCRVSHFEARRNSVVHRRETCPEFVGHSWQQAPAPSRQRMSVIHFDHRRGREARRTLRRRAPRKRNRRRLPYTHAVRAIAQLDACCMHSNSPPSLEWPYTKIAR